MPRPRGLARPRLGRSLARRQLPPCPRQGRPLRPQPALARPRAALGRPHHRPGPHRAHLRRLRAPRPPRQRLLRRLLDKTKLLAQRLARHLAHRAGLDLAQLERTITHPDEPVHRDAQIFHHPADLAVLALAQPHREPGIRPLLAVELHLHRRVIHPLHRDTRAQPLKLRLAYRPVDPHPVAPQPPGRGQLQPPLDLAIIGQKQQPLRGQVQPPDRHHPRHVRRQALEHGLAPLLVHRRGDDPRRLVVKPDARGFGRGHGHAIHRQPVARRHVHRGRGGDPAVHRHPAVQDHAFGIAARGNARPAQHLGDALALGNVRIVCRHAAP